MIEIIEAQITEIEERLRQAMLTSDVRVLNELLAPDIIITSHRGELLKKPDDLAAHESGAFQFHELNPSERQIQICGEVAIVSVRMQIVGSYQGSAANGDFRFTRVWAHTEPEIWQIVAAHISQVA